MNVGTRPKDAATARDIAQRRRSADTRFEVEHAPKSAQDVRDHVATRLLSRQKLRRTQGPDREQVPVGGAMREFEPLTITQEVYGVVAYHISTAYAEHRDFVVGPRADLAVATPQLAHVRPHFFHGFEQALCR